MNFSLTCSSPRQGVLTLSSGQKIRTPALALPTRTLAVPHMTRDVLERVVPQSWRDRVIIEAYAEDLLQNDRMAATCPLSIHRLCGWSGFYVSLATKARLPFDLGSSPTTRSLSPSVDSVNSCDSSNSNSSKCDLSTSSRDIVPRLEKCPDPFVWSENRSGRIKVTASQLKELAARFQPDLVVSPTQLAPINGSNRLRERAAYNSGRFLQALADLPDLAGPSTDLRLRTFSSRQELSSSSDPLGRVLRERLGDVGSFKAALGDFDVVDAGLAFDLAEASLCLQPDGSLLEMRDEGFKMDCTLLTPGCRCVSCTEGGEGFLKAAVHHYVVVEEMLAPLLLAAHNLHQLLVLLPTDASN